MTKDIVAEILAEAKSLHTKEELTHALSKRISQIQIFLCTVKNNFPFLAGLRMRS